MMKRWMTAYVCPPPKLNQTLRQQLKARSNELYATIKNQKKIDFAVLLMYSVFFQFAIMSLCYVLP